MEELEAKEVGARIRRARDERGLTQEELAGMASFSKRSLQDYEAGKTAAYRHLGELSRLLNRPREWFLYGDDTLAALDEQNVRRIIREEIEAAFERRDAADSLPRSATA